MINRLLKTLLLLLLLKGALFAQQAPSFTISTTGNIALLATIDNLNYSLPNMAQTWYNLQPGTIQVKVYQFQNRPGTEPGYKEVYNGTVKLFSGRHTELVVARFGKVMFDENDIAADTWATGIPGSLGGGSGYGNNTQVAVNANDFAEIKKSLEEERFSDGKLELARVIFKTNGFTTVQIWELSSQFIYDNDKLQFLILAYPACMDKGNYHILARELKYSSDREALMDFIGKQ